ncbi:hypothetical protein ASD45_00130 [Pseudolabrys sp. Root1462]|nr:hypothetical protein ASD45_00130 [Pseudolabrys sp. Root1462]
MAPSFGSTSRISIGLRAKLLTIFGATTLTLIGTAAFAFWSFSAALNQFEDTLGTTQTNAIAVVAMEADFKKQVQEWKDTLLRGKNPDALKKHWGNFQVLDKQVRQEADTLASSIADQDANALVKKFAAAHTVMSEKYHRAFDNFKDSKFDSVVGDAAVAGMDRPPTEFLTQARARLQTLLRASNEQSATAAAKGRSAITIDLILFALATILSAVALVAMTQKILIAPIKQLGSIMRKMAAGDMQVVYEGSIQNDEIGDLIRSASDTTRRISNSLANIKSSTNEVNSASAEISTSTTDLSQRTEEQAASLEETSAAMEELAATVRKNAENAQLANQDAAMTREVAERGGQVVAKAVNAMARIEESSRKVSDIIGVIDEIARQTNLLALNAAVEAARAGEAGRGFAVVASEVRSLAQRSSQAAKDIKDLITNSNGQVKDGVDLVNKAGASLNEIVESIKKVAVVVSEIANASAEQATGIDQINRALTQMDEVTQQNSALVEENAATAKTLEQQAKAMDEQVSVFKIGKEVSANATAISTRLKPAEAKAAMTRSAKPAIKPAANAREMQRSLATAVGQDWKEF